MVHHGRCVAGQSYRVLCFVLTSYTWGDKNSPWSLCSDAQGLIWITHAKQDSDFALALAADGTVRMTSAAGRGHSLHPMATGTLGPLPGE
jgi:hypothetical protein